MNRPKGGGSAKTPMLPITLIGDNSFDSFGLIDSGADYSVIPEGIAQLLGLKYDGEKHPTFGIGGSVHCIDSKMQIQIEMDRRKYTIIIPVKVILGKKGDDMPILIGRAVFFDKFEITFMQKQMKFRLKKV